MPDDRVRLTCDVPVQVTQVNENALDLEPVSEPPNMQLHWSLLSLSIVVISLSFLLRVPGEEKVYLPFASNIALPGTCYSREFMGIPCPGCGLTRSFLCLARGQVFRAWHFNPGGFLLFGMLLAQVPYRLVQIWRVGHGKHALHLRGWPFFLYLIMAVLIIQWLPKLVGRFL